jgi:hypothetical protein
MLPPIIRRHSFSSNSNSSSILHHSGNQPNETTGCTPYYRTYRITQATPKPHISTHKSPTHIYPHRLPNTAVAHDPQAGSSFSSLHVFLAGSLRMKQHVYPGACPGYDPQASSTSLFDPDPTPFAAGAAAIPKANAPAAAGFCPPRFV